MKSVCLSCYFVSESVSSVDNAAAASKSKQARNKRRRNKARGGVTGGLAKSRDTGTDVGVVGNMANESTILGSSDKTRESEAGDGPRINRVAPDPVTTAKNQLQSREGTPAGDKNSDLEHVATNGTAGFDQSKNSSNASSSVAQVNGSSSHAADKPLAQRQTVNSRARPSTLNAAGRTSKTNAVEANR